MFRCAIKIIQLIFFVNAWIVELSVYNYREILKIDGMHQHNIDELDCIND